MIAAGVLNKRVSLLAAAVTQDQSGGPANLVQFAGPMWAKVSPMTGSEVYRAQQFVAEATVQVVIRYRPGVLSNMIVQFQSKDLLRTLRVLAVLNEAEKNEQLTLLCEEVNDQ